jgi:hypothetical protein
MYSGKIAVPPGGGGIGELLQLIYWPVCTVGCIQQKKYIRKHYLKVLLNTR